MARLAATVITLGITAATLADVTPASAAPLPTPSVSPTTITAGDSYTVSGTGCVDVPGAPLPTVTVDGMVVPVDAGGSWSITARSTIAQAGPETLLTYCRLSTGTVAYPQITIYMIPAPVPVPTGAVTTPPSPMMPSPPPPPPFRPRGPGLPPVPTATPGRQPAAGSGGAAGSAVAPASTTPSGPTTTSPSAAPPPGFAAAPGCRDCVRLAGDRPLTSGTELALVYSGFEPGEQVTVVMRSTPVELGTFPADASGVVTATVTLPDSAEPGSHTLTFSGSATGDRVIRFRLAAAAAEAREPATPPSPSADGSLPFALSVVLVLLLSAGGLVWHRRRSSRTGRSQPGGPAQPTETPIAEPIA